MIETSANTLYVKGIDVNATNTDVVTAFERFGKVANATVRPDKGFAFVMFAHTESVDAAIAARNAGEVRS
jgi:RNA recognition motif-containing protein